MGLSLKVLALDSIEMVIPMLPKRHMVQLLLASAVAGLLAGLRTEHLDALIMAVIGAFISTVFTCPLGPTRRVPIPFPWYQRAIGRVG